MKDWNLENIRSMDRLTATLQVDGHEVRKSNPLEFPWGYGVVLANISRKAFAGTDLGNVIPPERVICQDEIAESVDAEAFQQRL